MKIWIFSDLHLEFGEPRVPLYPPEGVDVCVMAGDLLPNPVQGIKWLARNVPVPSVYVAGNHEFYGGALMELRAEARAVAEKFPDVHFLDDDLTVIGGVRFVGSTLWTDFRLMGQQHLAMSHASLAMNDFRLIDLRKSPGWQPFRPQDSLSLHEQSVSFIEGALKIPFDGPTVVVTHHCPHPRSVHKKYEGDLLNAAFASDLGHVIELGRPTLWVHGHTHSSFDYVEGGTRVICNPRGYVDENREFNPDLVVEVA